MLRHPGMELPRVTVGLDAGLSPVFRLLRWASDQVLLHAFRRVAAGSWVRHWSSLDRIPRSAGRMDLSQGLFLE